ncbi:GIY-YIG nuclease family protein [Pseudomonas sp. WS 5013]|uniref:GIY-YIG nuclease family protein n=1 Tax=Pseudomonas sp. WS 5013 TaxID=2717475 RepID=UPI001473362F|nr:GIY-YIG nuclease family protein [Pseudomonas sp. WS 5013]NMY43493.1 GIY-YIG nuclease family protein [Pseudomonas sp. WS 5013]
MLTPAKYWRVACELDCEIPLPPSEFILPERLASQASPPSRGHGITIAAYDDSEQMGLLRWLGVIAGGTGSVRHVEWKQTSAQIWVDSGTGRNFWKSGEFGFAPKKIADYGLHELWQEHFDGLELRDHTRMESRPAVTSRPHPRKIAPERLIPVEVVGQATTGAKAGVVYVLKSAYGYKVGRTRSVPNRMRAFGVHLPFVYTIPLCVWFDDCHMAEHRYHEMFADKRINGEWFDLDEQDIQQIRLRA